MIELIRCGDTFTIYRDQRFWSKVDIKPGGCWEWLAATTPGGYGLFWSHGKHQGAHRVSYELANGSIPEGLWIDHLCRVRNCVNPSHLEAVTPRENILRGLAARPANTHCGNGHPWNMENTYRYPSGDRRCRVCHRDKQREYARLKREARK